MELQQLGHYSKINIIMKYSFGLWKYNDGKEIRFTPYLDVMDNDYLKPLIDYFVMLDYHYIKYKQGNNIDNWISIIDKQLYLNNNEEYIGDFVCVFFEFDKVKVISFNDYDSGKENYCKLDINIFRRLTIEWKWFVIDWEISLLVKK